MLQKRRFRQTAEGSPVEVRPVDGGRNGDGVAVIETVEVATVEVRPVRECAARAEHGRGRIESAQTGEDPHLRAVGLRRRRPDIRLVHPE